MAKLRYFYGVMGSMKSSTLLIKAHQFKDAGMDVILLKSIDDTRNPGEISSRPISEGKECITFTQDDNLKVLIENIGVNIKFTNKVAVFVDEVQLCTKKHIHQLWTISKMYDIDVFCYGLRVTYKNTYFDCIPYLQLLADTTEEIVSRCKCGNKATTHIRYINDEVVTHGEDVLIGDLVGSERYESVCQVCWHEKTGGI